MSNITEVSVKKNINLDDFEKLHWELGEQKYLGSQKKKEDVH